MRFSHRVVLSFFIILSISFCVCIASIFFVRQIGASLHQLYEHPLTVSNAVRDINIHINAIHRSMKDVASAENDEELLSAVEKVVLSNHTILECFAIVDERFLGDHEKLDSAYSVYVAWEPIRKEVIALKSAGNDDAAIRITKGKGARHVELLFEKTKELTDFAQGKADEFYELTKQSERNSYFVFGAAILVLIVIGSISVLWLSRGITGPINEFIRKIVKIMERDGMLDLESNHHLSEQAIFDTTLEELECAYDKLKMYNAELDQRVEERTEELSNREAELRLSNSQIQELNELFKQQNADLGEAKLKAEESDRLKSAFLANMSHEIRTPMNAIIGFSELLNDDSVDEVTRTEYIRLIQSAGNQLLRLISDIVDLSKIDSDQLSMDPTPCHVRSFVETIYKRFELFVTPDGPTFDLSVAVDDDVWTRLDEQRMMQVLSNLVENAFKYTDEGTIELSCEVKEDSLLFCVKDTGIGISSEEQDKIFKRFHQVERPDDEKLREGTGLGLSICEALVRLMDGSICLESEKHVGSAFYVSIPLMPCGDLSLEQEGGDWNQSLGDETNSTVLIVEDEHSNRVFLRALLKKFHFTVLSAHNGLEAVEVLRSGQRPSIILMDLKMPKMDGYEALKYVKEICPNIPVIAQTAYAMANDREKVMAAGFDDYITKPISGELLAKKMDHLLNAK